jgi:formate-dependent nitrite reductase membrane component NrfD
MPSSDHTTPPRIAEARLDSLREQARSTGHVGESGVTITGGPIPGVGGAQPGYYGQPIIKAPVWTWQVGLYFFVGGTAGMSGVLAFAGVMTGQSIDFITWALGVAVAGALVSPCLLIWDLGRPTRFLNMLRVFKWRSAMSMGVWILVTFSTFAGAALLAAEALDVVNDGGVPAMFWQSAVIILVTGTALLGALLATYTGVLLGATVVPAWSAHHKLLPFHFGIVALGSAAAVMELLGFRLSPLNAIGLTVSAAETIIGAWLEFNRRGVTARALHHGRSGLLLRLSGALTGPTALILRLVGLAPIAAVCFVTGAILSRYGWIFAGRFSALDTQETIESQR